MTEQNLCTVSLQALASGSLDVWTGLSPDCTRQTAEEVFGESEMTQDSVGFLNGSPTGYRAFPALPAAPSGILVWFVEDQIVLIRIQEPKLPPLESLLGKPEATAPSQLHAFHTQWIYATRGLTAHVQNQTGKVAWLFTYPPMTAAAFLASWISRVSTTRIPNRR